MPEPASATRSDFQRDRDRIIHSAAFRRLALKTQVFLPEHGDHFRTRLTHTIEVAQIARSIARALGLDEDLTEAMALAHDLGHTPFGHTGEDALDTVMRPFGGFDHNTQTLRIVSLLERRYPHVPGLNLTWDTLDGLVNRHGAARRTQRSHWQCMDVPCLARDDGWGRSFDTFTQPGAEAQAAAVADDIAYNAHDLEDGLVAGLFTLGDLDHVPLLAELKEALRHDQPKLPQDLLVRGLARELVGRFVDDAIHEGARRLAEARPGSADAVRSSREPVVALSPAFARHSDDLKSFLFTRMYRHPDLLAVRMRARTIVERLAGRLLAEPWRFAAQAGGDEPADAVAVARRVSDYVAGMTDRFAVAEHRRLFDDTPELG